jgi:hypothetical protein
MKYFTYNLKPISLGEAIGPDAILPENSQTGYVVSDPPYIYYGAADIESLDILKEYNAVEIPKEEFDTVYSASIVPFPPPIG